MFSKPGILLFVSFWATLPLFGQFSEIPWQSFYQQYISSKKDKVAYAEYILTHAHRSKATNVCHVYFKQQFQGVTIQNATLSLHVDAQGKIIQAHDKFIQNLENEFSFPEKPLSLEKVLKDLWPKLGFQDLRAWKIVSSQDGASMKSKIDTKGYFFREVSAERKISCNPNCNLNWEIEYESKDGRDIKRVYVDAINGQIVKTINLVTDCSFHHSCSKSGTRCNTLHHDAVDTFQQYEVLPLKTESPNHGSRQKLMWVSDSIASPFGWHDSNGMPGHDYTTTRGNNVEAREDIDGNNSTLGQLAEGGDSLLFNFPILQDSHPHVNQNAALANLFYWNNIMHDIFYQYGFDEAAGNFQVNNYENGGLANDPVNAQALDGGGLNNANFYTPIDGAQPRMQMYLWSGPRSLVVESPPNVSGNYEFATAAFGSTVFTINNQVILADDGSTSPTKACNPLINFNQINGKIAMIDRGNCEFGQKCLHAQNAGAIAVIICNNVDGAPFVMGSGTFGHFVDIPCVMLSKSVCDSLKVYLDDPVTMEIVVGQPVDGDFDDAVICHEYGHGISNRLTGGAGENSCLSNQEQMGEGWSDWFGLMLTMHDFDDESRHRGIGTFVKNQPVTGPGIRPYKYSTDMTVNPHTYQSIATASIPHGVGAVWSAMLWELTWAFIREYGYDANLYAGTGGNNKALAVVVEALKLQPCNPGFVDARNAILLADSLLFNGENTCLIWKSFAKRGLGYSAAQGNPNNRADGVESFDMPPSCCLCVSNNLNDGNGSLRQAIDCALNGDTITFLNFLHGDTINLEEIPVTIQKNISLVSHYDKISIKSTGDFPVFILQGQISLENLTLHAGSGGDVRAIINEGDLLLKNIIILDQEEGQASGKSILNVGNLNIEGTFEVLDH